MLEVDEILSLLKVIDYLPDSAMTNWCLTHLWQVKFSNTTGHVKFNLLEWLLLHSGCWIFYGWKIHRISVYYNIYIISTYSTCIFIYQLSVMHTHDYMIKVVVPGGPPTQFWMSFIWHTHIKSQSSLLKNWCLIRCVCFGRHSKCVLLGLSQEKD